MTKPFGFRILVEVDNNKMENILGGKLLTGKITEISEAITLETENPLLENNNYTVQGLLYSYANCILKKGMEVSFTYTPDIVNIIDNNIYNVPIELIRQYNETIN